MPKYFALCHGGISDNFTPLLPTSGEKQMEYKIVHVTKSFFFFSSFSFSRLLSYWNGWIQYSCYITRGILVRHNSNFCGVINNNSQKGVLLDGCINKPYTCSFCFSDRKYWTQSKVWSGYFSPCVQLVVSVPLAENISKTFSDISKSLLKAVILRTVWFNSVGTSLSLSLLFSFLFFFLIAKFQAYMLQVTQILMKRFYFCKYAGSKKYSLFLICLTFTAIAI